MNQDSYQIEDYYALELERLYQRKKRDIAQKDLALEKKIKKEMKQEAAALRSGFLARLFVLKKTKKSEKFFENFEAKNQESNNLAKRILQKNIYHDGATESALDPEVGEAEEGAEEAEEEGRDDFEKEQAAEKAKQMGLAEEEKKAARMRAVARMERLTKQVQRIKTALHAAKISSALGGLVSLGITILLTILIWIGQFIGRYMLGIEIIPKFDLLDFVLMAIVGFLISIILLPVAVISAII